MVDMFELEAIRETEKFVKELFEEAGKLPPKYQKGHYGNYDLALDERGETVLVYKPKNPEDKYRK